MTFLDRFLSRFGLQRKGFAPGPGGAGFAAGSNATTDIVYETDELAFRANPFVRACVQMIGNTVCDLPIKVYTETQKNGKTDREELPDHPLAELLWRPSPRMSSAEFKRDLASYMALDGECLIFIENGSGGEGLSPVDIKRLQIMKPRFITEVHWQSNGLIDHYVYAQGGTQKRIAPEFVCHPRNYNPFDDARGIPAIDAIRNPLLLQYYIDQYERTFFKNDARPELGIAYKGAGKLDPAVATSVVDAWKKKNSGENKRGIIVMDNFELKEFGTTAKDGEFLGLDNASRNKVAAVFGVPPILLGVFEFANYANADQQLRLFYEYTIQPLVSIICGAINSQIIPVWFGNERGLYVEADYSAVEVLQGDNEAKARTHQIYVTAGIKTVNEVRTELSLEVVEGGDELREPSTGFGGLDFGELGAPGPSYRKALPPVSRDDRWKAFAFKLESNEKKVSRSMSAFFVDQGKRVASKLEAVGVLAGVSPKSWQDAQGVAGVREMKQSDVFGIFDLEFEDEEIVKAILPIMQSIIGQVGTDALASIGSSVAFNEVDPRVLSYLAKKELLVKGINRTTEKILTELLVDASADGVSVAETARRIRNTFEFMGQGDQFSQSRSETIARTETIGANNFAATEGYKQSGVVARKQWLSSRDAFVRDSHMVLDGEEVPLDGKFSNGLSEPGVDGPADEVINCRCTVIPVLED